MAEPKPFTFVISDESINSYGFRVLTDGIDLSLFLKNPIALWVHSRSSAWNDKDRLPIGKWENIRVEGKKLLADLVFDDDDEFAVKLKKKVEKGIINMASAGLRVVATSEDKAVLIKGQTRPTVIKSLLTEASLVDIGSNSNALRLQDEFGEEITLSDKGSNHLLPLLGDTKKQNTDMNFQEQVALAVKLSANASEADILKAVQNAVAKNVELSGFEGQVTTLQDEKEELSGKLKVYQDVEAEAEKQKCVDLVDQAVADKKITDSEKAEWLELAEGNYELAEKQLGKITGAKNPEDEGKGEVKLSAWDARMKEINENLKK
ncbi:hypothetical protein [uncultured Draconibacterium sp.]|uniref:hypothetical protein n=1 Tax=uncultured Draconibacterium sp. TaxID=1573823 RepID=UPI0025DC766F|nr:hypothetical protein [uncultured Draconibacterium sp.]